MILFLGGKSTSLEDSFSAVAVVQNDSPFALQQQLVSIKLRAYLMAGNRLFHFFIFAKMHFSAISTAPSQPVDEVFTHKS